jgi:hypothetical protein
LELFLVMPCDVTDKVPSIDVDSWMLYALGLNKLTKFCSNFWSIFVMVEVDLLLKESGILRRFYFALKIKN